MTANFRLILFLALELYWARRLWRRRPALMWGAAGVLVVVNVAAHTIKRNWFGPASLPDEGDHLYRAFYNGVVTGHYLFGFVAVGGALLLVARWALRKLLPAGSSDTNNLTATPARSASVSRRDILSAGLSAGVSGGFALAGLGTLAASKIEPHEIVVERWKVPVPYYQNRARGFRIVQLTDPHVGPMFDRDAWRYAIRTALAEKPDLLALTGDFIDRVNDKWLEPFLEPLKEIPYLVPAIAVTGNHDVYWGQDRLQKTVEEHTNVRFLRNGVLSRFVESHGIEITGVDDPVSQRPFLKAEAGGMPDDTWLKPNRSVFRLLLAHRPWVVRTGHVQRAFDLTLSGHTHGGMMTFNIPGLPEWRLFRPLYDRGWYAPDHRLQEHGWLFVSRGLGYAGPRVRFNCPPEVTVLELSGDVDVPFRTG